MNTRQDARAGDGPQGPYDLAGAPEGLGSLISGVIKDLQDLLRAEIQLARTEIKEDATAAGKGIAFLVAGALIGLVAFFFLMLAASYFLDKYVDRWAGPLIVAAALGLIAAILALSGRSKLRARNLKPEQTIETLKEDQQWAKQQINSAKR